MTDTRTPQLAADSAPPPTNFPQAVRARPEMWFGSADAAGLHEMVCDVLAHEIDLAVMEKITRLEIDVDGASFRIRDDGPGMPLRMIDGLPMMTAVFVRPGMSPVFDGHSVHSRLTAHSQLPAVSAACDEIHLITYRSDGVYEQRIEAGEPVGALDWRGRLPEEQDAVGTTMWFRPSPQVFGEAAIDVQALAATAHELLAFLPNLLITINDVPVPRQSPAELVGGTDAHITVGTASVDGDVVQVTLVNDAPAGSPHRAFLNFRELTGDPEMVEHCVAEALESAGVLRDDVAAPTVVVHALFQMPDLVGPDLRVCASPQMKTLVVAATLAARPPG